jgi:hypothetical protein
MRNIPRLQALVRACLKQVASKHTSQAEYHCIDASMLAYMMTQYNRQRVE